MNEEEFWELIEESKRQTTATLPQHKWLEGELLKKPVKEVIDYIRIFDELRDLAYRWDIWHVAYIIMGGCSDDAFTDFRGWLISRGKKVFYECIARPESVDESLNGDEPVYEDMTYIGHKAYCKLTGESEVPDHYFPPFLSKKPAGTYIPDEELPKHFPALCKKYDDM